MPPRKAKKNASTASDEGTQIDQTAPNAVPKAEEETHTPEQEPTKKTAAAGITQAQKQALIDNLQLESAPPQNPPHKIITDIANATE